MRHRQQPDSSGSRARTPWALALSNALYLRLLLLYPAAFRRAYGPHMAQLFRDCCRLAWQQQGVAGVSLLWLHTLFDTAQTAFAEHLTRERIAQGETATMTRVFWIRLGAIAAILSAPVQLFFAFFLGDTYGGSLHVPPLFSRAVTSGHVQVQSLGTSLPIAVGINPWPLYLLALIGFHVLLITNVEPDNGRHRIRATSFIGALVGLALLTLLDARAYASGVLNFLQFSGNCSTYIAACVSNSGWWGPAANQHAVILECIAMLLLGLSLIVYGIAQRKTGPRFCRYALVPIVAGVAFLLPTTVNLVGNVLIQASIYTGSPGLPLLNQLLTVSQVITVLLMGIWAICWAAIGLRLWPSRALLFVLVAAPIVAPLCWGFRIFDLVQSSLVHAVAYAAAGFPIPEIPGPGDRIVALATIGAWMAFWLLLGVLLWLFLLLRAQRRPQPAPTPGVAGIEPR